jgi:hypothetical protein
MLRDTEVGGNIKMLITTTTLRPKGIYNARCLGEMLRLINLFLVKHWCLYRLDRCLTKHLFYTNKHQYLAKCLIYFSKHLL